MYRTDYKPTIAWRASLSDVLLFSASDAGNHVPAVFTVKATPIDVNNAGYGIIEVGLVLVDFIGHMYTITELISTNTFKVRDDLFTEECPQNGMQAVICKTVDDGTAPLIPPTMYSHLDKSARQYIESITYDILRRTRTRVDFTNVVAPRIDNYQQDYAFHYGEYPSFKLVIYVESGVEWMQLIEPIRYLVDGKLDHIVFDLDGDPLSGYIIIER